MSTKEEKLGFVRAFIRKVKRTAQAIKIRIQNSITSVPQPSTIQQEESKPAPEPRKHRIRNALLTPFAAIGKVLSWFSKIAVVVVNVTITVVVATVLLVLGLAGFLVWGAITLLAKLLTGLSLLIKAPYGFSHDRYGFSQDVASWKASWRPDLWGTFGGENTETLRGRLSELRSEWQKANASMEANHLHLDGKPHNESVCDLCLDARPEETSDNLATILGNLSQDLNAIMALPDEEHPAPEVQKRKKRRQAKIGQELIADALNSMDPMLDVPF